MKYCQQTSLLHVYIHGGISFCEFSAGSAINGRAESKMNIIKSVLQVNIFVIFGGGGIGDQRKAVNTFLGCLTLF